MTWLWVIASAGGLAALGAAFFFGFRYAEARNTALAGEAFQKAKKEADAHEHELATANDDKLDADLARWMRPDK